MPVTEATWLDREPRPLAAVKQAVELALDGIRQPLVLAIALALLSVVVGAITVLAPLSYAPTVVLRAQETDGDQATMPVPRRQVAEYVRVGVFTSAPLLELVHRHGLYSSLAAKNPRAAVDSFREDIDVGVGDNYFAEGSLPGAAPRSVRIFITFHGPSPDVAVAVTRELAALVVSHEKTARAAASTRALERAEREARAAEQVLAARRMAIAARHEEARQAPAVSPLLEVGLMSLVASIPALEVRRDAAQQGLAVLSLGAAQETRGLGLSFDIVSDGTLSSAARYRGRDRKAYLAVATLVLGLPLVAMAVGAFAPRRGSA
jgi:hypothetical protein